MSSSLFSRRVAGAVMFVLSSLALPVAGNAAGARCEDPLTRGIPDRAAQAPSGSALMERLLKSSGTERDLAVVQEVLAGNVPSFLRRLTPVTIAGTAGAGAAVLITICVTPEYLAVGDDRDFVRVPMGLPAAAQIADRLGFLLPTPKMVDAIYGQARVQMAPSPMKPTNQMSSTAYLLQHDRTVEAQRSRMGQAPGALTAGQKKDIVLSNRLRSKPGRVAIYGWHRRNGVPIQPLSTVHGARYADYSHGVRLVSQTAYVNGAPRPLTEIMQDRDLAPIVSSEGPIRDVQGLMASLY